MCLVNCHLAAGQSQTVGRNNDAAAILESALLPAEGHPVARADTFIGGGDGSMILDHEICLLNGDLNYRIDTMGRDTVIKAITNNNFEKLLERDQLLVSRRRNPGFRLRAFTESLITFAPTYKYDIGSDRYDTSEKRRAPAWCDRILYRGASRIKQIQYRRHEIRISDHRPVSGTFKMRIKTIQPEKRTVAWKESIRRFEEIKQKLFSEAKYVFIIQASKLDAADITLLCLGLPTFEMSLELIPKRLKRCYEFRIASLYHLHYQPSLLSRSKCTSVSKGMFDVPEDPKHSGLWQGREASATVGWPGGLVPQMAITTGLYLP